MVQNWTSIIERNWIFSKIYLYIYTYIHIYIYIEREREREREREISNEQFLLQRLSNVETIYSCIKSCEEKYYMLP